MIEIIKNTPASIVLICVLILVSHVSRAEIYQWKDADGRIHFGDKPQVENAEEIVFKELKLSEYEKEELHKRQVEKLKLIRLMEEERLNRENAKQKQLAYEKKVKTECEKTKNYKQDAMASPFLYEKDDEGNQHILDDKEFKSHMKEIDEYLKEYC